ncbi:MAG TPA: AAA domain-containing protein [Chitinophaga sp.]|uniref:AAA domain-containing protein n=1 Tax=Chitinophaga sp. TaxID=1869181 RepID=UPI002DBCE4C7|nr:AAA domain-containing protein [Chitinophaga sp.]HEU4553462.1 AAA domain-containing protein [Chitinophaga sp.]
MPDHAKKNTADAGSHTTILSRLRNRLFDTSRRNRLLYYKPGSRFVNLTAGSIPLTLKPAYISPAALFTWQHISKAVKGQQALVLNTHLHLKEHPYLPAQLNALRQQATNDEREYGFNQLRLVVAFLHWENLQAAAGIRIQSPLLLLPVKLKRSKGAPEEKFTLEITDSTAIVNPVLAQHLQELYGITLPESVAFDKAGMQDFYEAVKAQLTGAGQQVHLHFKEQPDVAQLYYTAQQTVNTYLKRLRQLPAGAALHETTAPPPVAAPGPLHWELDICNLVLGNFNYKKMSLVRDYNQALAQDITHPVFTTLFSDRPKAPPPPPVVHAPAEWYHVISADPTQTNAILQSRTGQSYIIQGPPGTGKSQTITNLVADYLARGKSVLFVCEKRAALDVVYHRLQQNNLAELCCYIHDSQADKKAFIQELKSVYGEFLRSRMDFTHLTLRRQIATEHLQRQLQVLQAYHIQQQSIYEDAGITTRELIARLIDLQPHIPSPDSTQQAAIPGYSQWLQFGDTLQTLAHTLEQQGAAPALALHPFRNLGNGAIQSDQAFTLVHNMAAHAQSAIDQIVRIITTNQLPYEHTEKLANIIGLVKTAAVLAPLAERSNLHLVDPTHKDAKRFEKAYRRYRKLQKAYKQAAKINSKWLHKFSPQETQYGLAIAGRYEQSFFRFFSSSWKRLKKQLLKAYDFSGYQLPPAYGVVLQQLQDEYAALEKMQEHLHHTQQKYRVDNLQTIHIGIETLRRKLGDAKVDYLLQHPAANELVLQLNALNNTLQQLELQLRQCLYRYGQKSLLQVNEELTAISRHAGALQKLLPALQAFAALPLPLQEVIRHIPLTPAQAEAAMAQASLQLILDRHPGFAATTQHTLQQAVTEIDQTYQLLLQLNSDYIRAKRRQQFLQHYAISHTAATQLTPAQKAFKKQYAEGRRVLEHEMSKTMRFRSIREIASAESGLVLKDIKPVWLMSPLSVSDSLPPDHTLFDVVIFDEASQIPVEEGIPALFRAPQAIIAGDDKQMPPAQFFRQQAATDTADAPDDHLTAAESLLLLGAGKLPDAMLSWHYRSRYESLISFSNHAFYGAALLTIPDRTTPVRQTPLQHVQQPEEGAANAQLLLQPSITWHYLPNGIYENRRNDQEANYVAHLVKQLLLDNVQDSIGIVAFSQEQQAAIIAALNTLAAADREFEALLENAGNREEAGQFTGLFVKNLENVQGDERDIIIISVCYGHDRQHDMRMHFGPINRPGGEKRLNVIFSRARRHMAVVSSIRHQHITNEHNDGARYFKRFLQYAEMVSSGNTAQARQVLDDVAPPGKQASYTADNSNTVTQQIKAALEAAGLVADTGVGQSSFKCSLAVKRQAADTQYCLGILVDDAVHYRNPDVMEQYYQRPAILQAFGWQTVNVYAKDWLEDRERVMELIWQKLSGNHRENKH